MRAWQSLLAFQRGDCTARCANGEMIIVEHREPKFRMPYVWWVSVSMKIHNELVVAHVPLARIKKNRWLMRV